MWSDLKGLFGGAAIRVSDIKFDQDQTSAYYGRHNVAVNDVLSGSVTKADDASLKKALTG